ncbi:MAG: DUF938 domain-containing protein [Lysobacterales bacterium]
MPIAAKPEAPSTERNREPILTVLREHFADRRRVLEIGSGSGQHAVYFAAALPHLHWQASDRADQLPGIEAWRQEAGLANTPAPIELDIDHWPWPALEVDAVFTANTLHIIGWDAVGQFFRGVGQVLGAGGKLLIYGPFNYQGQFTSASNASFDQWLRERDPASGIRDFEAVCVLAQGIGLDLIADIAMPANNRCLLFRRQKTEDRGQ